MNEYKDAVDVMARYISDCKIGIKRYSDRDIDNVMAKIVELEKHCNELEKALDAACYMLERFDNICHSIYPMTKKQWKEWLMNDEYKKSLILRELN